MRVTDLARRAGVGAHTIRYYVRAGLIAPHRNPTNNYKQFGEEDITRLRFIKAVQALGFSLNEVQGLLRKIDVCECPCDAIQEQLADKILGVRREIDTLGQRLRFMQMVYDRWSDASPEGEGVGELCRYLESRAAAEVLPKAAAVRVGPSKSISKPGERVGSRSKRAPLQKQGSLREPSSSPRNDSVSASLDALMLLQSGWRSGVGTAG